MLVSNGSVFTKQLSGATMFNLSILTSDMWAVIIRIYFYHQQVHEVMICGDNCHVLVA
uniref:Solute carrier family 35 member F1-like n=1 Tax=Rhizophora mucronata TaxID=61149 RepID=A0A2P2KI80_RHIMU